MAPKNRIEQHEKPQPFAPSPPPSSDEEDETDSKDEGIYHEKLNSKMEPTLRREDWKTKVVRHIKEWSQDEGIRSKAKWSAATVALLLLASTSWKRRRKQQRSTSNRPLLSSLVLPWLSRLLERPEYLSKAVLTVSFSILQAAAREGRVQKALVGSNEIVYQDRQGSWKRSKLPPGSPSLQKEMLEGLTSGGCQDIAALPPTLASKLASPLLAALPFVYLALVYRIMKNIHGGNDMKMLSDGKKQTKTTFADVAGLDTIMTEVQEIVNFLKHTRTYRTLGAKPPQGILLHGPPGSGKTLLARAVAGEADAAFLACSGSEFCEMYVGRGAARVRSLFQQARALAKQRGRGGSILHQLARRLLPSALDQRDEPPPTAIVFIDEFDALAKSRSYGTMHGNDEREATLNQLLTEMDGFSNDHHGGGDGVCIIVIAATNRPDILDPAILRRFDRQLHVPYPNAKGRREIMKIHARSTNCRMKSINWTLLSSSAYTANFSGSDLRNLVNDAALLAVRAQSPVVEQKHLEQAARRSQAMKSQGSMTSHSLGSTAPRGSPLLYFPHSNPTR